MRNLAVDMNDLPTEEAMDIRCERRTGSEVRVRGEVAYSFTPQGYCLFNNHFPPQLNISCTLTLPGCFSV